MKLQKGVEKRGKLKEGFLRGEGSCAETAATPSEEIPNFI
jgi:hypothetical protein